MDSHFIPVEALDHVALTVSNPEASMAWYQKILGFQIAAMEGLKQGPPFLLRVAPGNYLNLFPADTPEPSNAPDHNTLAMRHVAFRIPFDRMAEVENSLNEIGQVVMGFDYGPRCRALFISDPDGHQIELIGYADGVFTS